jgi:L-amino acid N-acyltransferase YncA
VREVRPFLPWCHPDLTPEDARRWIEVQKSAREDGTAFEFAIVSSDGSFLGGCGVNQIDQLNRRANLGYWVRSSATGRGVATLAVQHLVRWAFANTELVRLELVISTSNAASLRAAEKAGAMHDGVLRKRLWLHEVAHDAAVLSFVREPASGPAVGAESGRFIEAVHTSSRVTRTEHVAEIRSKMIIRDGTEADLPAIVDIYNAAIPGRLATADTEPVSVSSRRAWFLEHDATRHPLWVASVDSTIAGWLSFQPFYGRPAYHATAEISVYVAPNNHRRGIARALVVAAIEAAPRLGLKTLLGFIFGHNEPSLRLFAGFGFQRWALLPRVAELDGVERDLVIVGLRIGT